jgi:hypothetical protein
VQRAPFRAWRASHLGTRTSSWITGVGVAVAYFLVCAAAVVPIYLLLANLPHPRG